MRPNRLKAALAAGEIQVGSILAQFRSPEIVRIYKAAGFDWVFIDTEHGGFDIETVQDVCRVATVSGLTPLVRVPDIQYALVARALDCGAEGVIFPRVELPEVLERAVSWTRFPPVGTRGFGLTRMAVDYAQGSMPEIMQYANQNVLTVLSISLGVPGEFEHPTLVSAVESVIDTCVRRNIVPGIHLRVPRIARYWRERGMRLLSCSTDATMLLERATDVLQEITKRTEAGSAG
jgi:2-dehydro-3-deoxyglucarate aldolase/4-hydroxy-2-oxoheptanedioate aldolase